ncbi:hypothetical protein IE81DRAFT_314998 [Ceraceosorus guamensis]|uniref:Mob1/phocein n=1 Tax=Ceraceosorus guamensis TaxID=1522189 RepID=A0A316VVH7_9BASI|nr:hypothetical protein IE81DRAFT_314998 [Ceraceosorus guamensis]PWN41452.1 hypothetical protein IE81DRAFT_314998 [Ceraceosorus guamensis]
MSNFFRSMGRSSRPKKSPTLPGMPFEAAQAQMLANATGGHNVGLNGKALYMCNPFVRSALIKGSFKTIVALPKYVDPKEWVAVNLFDFFNNLNQFYGVVTEFCTIQNNPTMSAGIGLDYTWIDQNRKQVKLPAPQYIDYVMTWVGGLLSDEATFPTKASREFPQTFLTTAKHVYKQLLRVFAHIYHAQFPYLVHLCCEGHFNSLFAHFIAFGAEFDLFNFKEFKGPQGAPYPGVCDLIEKWIEMGILDEAVLK